MKAPLMRRINANVLLNLVREQGPISRADLSKLSHLSKPTVSSQIDALVRQGLVMEIGTGVSGVRGGKKPTLVRFNSDAGRLLAAEIGPEKITAALTDLDGKILSRAAVDTPAAEGAPRVLSALEKTVRGLLEAARGWRKHLKVMSVAAPGSVDVSAGRVLEADNIFGWREVAVRERLERAFAVPVFVDNDVNMAALAEMRHGVARAEKNFVLLRLNTGIGAGVVLNGQIYHGAHWSAGEIGHIVLDLSAADREWGPRGYLESVLGSDCIARRVREEAGRSANGLRDRLVQQAELPALFGAAQTGDRDAARLVRDLTFHAAHAIVHVVTAYDPALVVLEGDLFVRVLDEATRLVSRTVPWPVRMELSALGEDAVLLGAIDAAREEAREQISQAHP